MADPAARAAADDAALGDAELADGIGSVVLAIARLLRRRDPARLDRSRGRLIHHNARRALALLLAPLTHVVTVIFATILALLVAGTRLPGAAPSSLGSALVAAVSVPTVAAATDEKSASAPAARPHPQDVHVPGCPAGATLDGATTTCDSLRGDPRPRGPPEGSEVTTPGLHPFSRASAGRADATRRCRSSCSRRRSAQISALSEARRQLRVTLHAAARWTVSIETRAPGSPVRALQT